MTARATLATALVLLALVAAAGRAQIPAPVVPPMSGSPGLPPPFPYVEDEPGLLVRLFVRSAGLTSEQSHKVHQVLGARRARLQAVKSEVRAAQDALADRMAAAGSVTGKDVAPDVERLTRAHRAQIEEIVATALELRSVLTPEQLVRVARWRDRFRTVRRELEDLVDDGGGTGPRP